MDGVRLKVEGASYPYKASVIKYHNDYPEISEARKIEAQVGMENCKIAFFLGRTELLGSAPARTRRRRWGPSRRGARPMP